MANKAAATIIREEDLTDLETFQHTIEDRIEDAQGDGRIYMMQQYTRILAGVKAEVKRIRNRFDRESLAAHRNALKALKKEQKEKADAAENAPAPEPAPTA